MSILPVTQAGNPILVQTAQAVPTDAIQSNEIKAIISNMIDTMKKYNGVGIAAPQIDINLRIIVYGFAQNPRYPGEGPVPLTVLINPEIVYQSQEQMLGFEGCLSLGTLRGEVPRATSLQINALDREAKTISKTAHGFEARILQHEIDHLNGILIVERMQNFKQFGFTEELKKHNVIP